MDKRKRSAAALAASAAFTALVVFTAAVGIGPTRTGSAGNVKLGLDLSGGASVTYRAVGETPPTREQMADTIYKLQKRVEAYSTEAVAYGEGDDRVTIEIPGATDANEILEDLGRPGSLEFRLPDGTVAVDGSSVASATAATTKDEMGNAQIAVELEFDEEGAKAFAEATTAHVGETIDIVYDGETVSSPRVNEPISDGRAQITGSFDMEEAENLASFIRIGSLDVELEELRSNVVGAQLGEDALESGIFAGLVGLAVVALIVLAAYGKMGALTAWSLAAYAAADVVALNAFDVTLTLPGVAGVVLTIGMAVDANVIVNSRTREELESGRSARGAIAAGYARSTSAIVDGNVTTLIAAAVLWRLGSGGVKGFAQTLALGTALSMAFALGFSRVLAASACELGFLRGAKDFGRRNAYAALKPVEWRRKTFAVAAAAALSGFVAMGAYAVAGAGPLNLGMEFSGGTATTVSLPKEATLDEIEDELKPIFREATGDAQAQAQKVAGSNDVVVKTRTLTVDEREAVAKGISEKFGADVSSTTFETISSTVSAEMRRDALVAVIAATLCMLAYIWIRFADAKFAVAAVAALAHDVAVTFACYAIGRIALGSAFIAVELTIVGYSINATIVIFDRARENLKTRSATDLAAVVDDSVSQTFSRSLWTTATTFAAVACLWAFGAPSIKEFAAPIAIGTIAGCFSSVFLAGAIWYALKARAAKG